MSTNNEPPLVVDLDGTLLSSDLLLETAIAYLRDNPHYTFRVFQWLLQGKAHLKDALARETDIDVSCLPYNAAVLSFISAERAQGRTIVMATASHGSLAERVAKHLGLFDVVLASDARCNLAAEGKRDLLIRRYGEKGFDYAGNGQADLPVWKAARRAYVVNPDSGVERRARRLGNVEAVIRSGSSWYRDWYAGLRVHQWLKNLLVFAPLAAAHRLAELPLLWSGVLAFVCFGLCASAVYVVNDLIDLDDDRHHPSKRKRPFADGRLSIQAGILAAPVLLAAAVIVAIVALPPAFLAVMAGYFLLTFAYSLFLKRFVAVDVITLAMLYTMRIIAGGAAMSISLSFWMLAFAMFIFLSLALVKRYAELHAARLQGGTARTRGRGYYPGDLEMVASLGAASGYMAVLVLALYINDMQAAMLYGRPEIIWLACPLLLYWVSRVWILTHRGEMHDDPVIFAISDRSSLVVGVLFVSVFWAAR